MSDLSEVLADCAQQANALAVQRGVAFFFDFRGSSFSLLQQRTQVRDLVVLLLEQGIEPMAGGCVFFCVDVIPHLTSQATVRLQLAYTGVPLSAPAVQVLSEATSVQQPCSPDPGHQASRGTRSDMAARCQALGGSLIRGELPGQGGVLHAELLLPFARLEEDKTRAREHGLQAWLIGDPPVVFESLTRRMQRLGWQVTLLPTVDAAEKRLASHSSMAPSLVMGAQHHGVAASALAALARRLPEAAQVVMGHLAGTPPPAAEGGPLWAVTLPIGVAELHRLTVQALERANRALRPLRDPLASMARRPRGLVVDDNLVNQLLLSEMLRVLGLEADVANDGQHAVQSCLRDPPALVLMDLDMPVLSGIDATRQLRELQRLGQLPRLPIVMVTARTGPDDRARAASAGVDAYLEKPVMLDTLQAVIHRVMPSAGAA